MAYQSKSNRKFLATTLTAAMVASAVAPAASAASNFPDVKEGSFYYEYVSALAEAGIIDGRPDGSFDLGGKLNRAEAAKMIAKIIKLDTTDAPASSFEDVKEDVWYTDYVNALYAEGLIDGVSETMFAPNQELTRAQLAKLVVDAYGLELDASVEHPFTDVKEDVWYTDYIKTLYKHDLIDGKTATTFAPNEPIKRADFAKLLTEADWAVGDTLEKPMPDEAMVTEVSAITALTDSYVEVTFDALEKDMAGATIEVKDNNGVIVEVEATDLAKGQTSAQFNFVDKYEDDLEGVWMVAGLEYNFDAIEQFNDIMSAVTATNQVKLLAALEAAGIENVDSALIDDYLTAISTASDAPQNLADIQEIIDETNEDSLTAEEEAAVVEAVQNAKTQVALLNVLSENFDRVNSDWIVKYSSGTATSAGVKFTAAGADNVVYTDASGTVGASFDDIQAAIDFVNDAAITAANTAADTAAEQAEVTSLIQMYVEDDAEDATSTPKADAVEASIVKTNVFRVAESTTQYSLYNNLVALANLEGTDLETSDLNDSLKAEYFAELNNTGVKAAIVATPTKATVATSVVTAADNTALTAALADLDSVTSATTTASLKVKLQELADVTSHLGDNKFDMGTVVDSRLTNYRDALASVSVAAQTDVETAIASVNGTANEAVNLAVIKDTDATVAEVRTALTELAAGVTANATTTAYLNASSQVKLEIAQLVIDNRSSLPATLTTGAVVATMGTGYSDAVIETAQADQAAKVAEFNTIGDLASATITSTKGALDTYAYAPYVALSASQKVAVAEEINKLTKPTSATDSTPVALDFSGVDAVQTLAKANDYIDAAVAKVKGN